MKYLEELLRHVINAKYIAIIVIVVFIGLFVWKNSDFISEVSFTIKNDNGTQVSKDVKDVDSKEETKENIEETINKPHLLLDKIILSPKSKNLPSIVVFGIKNNGKGTAKLVKVSIDLGIASVINYELIGFDLEAENKKINTSSIMSFTINEIKPQEYGYIYLHTNTPIFQSIVINTQDHQTLSRTLKEHLISNEKQSYSSGPTIKGTFEVIIMVAMWIFSTFFVFLTIVYLSVKSKLFS